MRKPAYLPKDYRGVAVVNSLSAVFNTSFGGTGKVNCILHPRRLSGDFNALARRLSDGLPVRKEAFVELTASSLARRVKRLTGAEKTAAKAILRDMKALEKKDLSPVLRVVGNGDYRDESLFERVHDFHADGVTAAGGYSLLCCYTTPVTEALRNQDAVRGDDGFFRKKQGAAPFRFRPGDIWRHAVLGTGEDIAPFIHRAPAADRQTPRLVLIAYHNGRA